MKRDLLRYPIILWACLFSVMGLPLCADNHDVFGEQARAIVSAGNHYYDRSYRAGIKQMADSLESVLKQQSRDGQLNEMDSLEFTADLLKLRADWHFENGHYDQSSYSMAQKLFHESLHIFEAHDAFKGHLQCAPMIYRELAQLHYQVEQYDSALCYTQKALYAYTDAWERGELDDNDSTLLLIRSQLAMCYARIGRTDEALDEMGKVLKEYDVTSLDYYEQLRKKGKILMLSNHPRAAAEALGCYRQYFSWVKSKVLASLRTMSAAEQQDYWMRMRPFVADCYRLEQSDPGFLYDVTLFCKGLLLQVNRQSGDGSTTQQACASLQYTWRDIQSKLKKNAVAIEFVQYEAQGATRMAALVLRKQGAPQWIPMMPPDEFMDYELGVWKNRERVYSTDGSKKNRLYGDSALQSMIWTKELIEAIGSSSQIYFAPDGYLHQVAIEYMWPDETAEKELFRLTSTRQLMYQKTVSMDAALIIGGVNYGAHCSTEEQNNDSEAYRNMQQERVNFENLAGSLSEAQSILAMRACSNDTLLVGSEATEEAWLSLCTRYPLICISTHGYFQAAEIPQSTDVKTCMTDETMSQSILAMAGANTSIASENFDSSRRDGVVSAREIAQTDMSQVQLIVVSACQTGLGYVTADGVFGIQRGLKNAGVQSMLVSLWSVDDKATSLLMSQFVQNLCSGMKPHRAFMAARESLRCEDGDATVTTRTFNAASLTETVSEENCYEAPQYRNAFILIDAIE